jgi:chromate reductase
MNKPGSHRPRILILNAALAGEAGNTAVALARLRRRLARRAEVHVLTLAGGVEFRAARPMLARANALVIGTGTHWDGWSSVLQKFLEDATAAEGSALWLGKPAACVVTEHSVGGKAVLSRLQGVLVTLGCLIPPMSGLVLSRAALLAAQQAPGKTRDFWSEYDLRVVAHNLLEAARGACGWRAWPVDRDEFAARWLK